MAQTRVRRSWSVREYTGEDKAGVFELRKAVYGEAFDEQEWDWKYSHNSVRSARIFLVESDGMIVGTRPGICLPSKVMDQVVTAGIYADVMTHPDFRRLGIFSTLVREAFEKMNKEGIGLVFSFPNENSYPGLVKLGWTHICSVPLLVMPLNFNNLVRKYTKITALQKLASLLLGLLFKGLNLREGVGKTDCGDIVIQKIHSFDSRFDELWHKVSYQYDIAVVRDRRYLNWRYVDKPGQEYVIFAAEKEEELAGYIVLKNNVEMFDLTLGLIVDMATIEDERIASVLLSHAIKHLKDQETDSIGCLMLKHVACYAALRKAGFIHVPELFSPKQFYFVGHTTSRVADSIAYDADNWFLTFGDIDIV
ncbi:MAG: GNAT family N-acetyltransferase [Candidatus Latescibacteria bacterium]|nr:GNAT family N-acetyltransferase [Candidatus Latescibacterota bacterium]